MTKASYRAAVLVTLACAVPALVPSADPRRAAAAQSANPRPIDPALAGSAIVALLEANKGKPPATGDELVKTLNKLGKFAQLPVVFSAVHLDSGLANPRVVITPVVTGLSEAGVTEPNLNNRLFLAANMEKGVGGADPKVTMVEFISWNSLRRKFDFGVIENMGGDGEPQLKIVDGGRCYSCHKNRGPILGATPWSNTSQDDVIRLALSLGYAMEGAKLPETGPFALPRQPGKGFRDRIDGMALCSPEGSAVDLGVRLGSALSVNRDTFRLMTKSPDGRKAFVGLLVAVVSPGQLDPNDKAVRQALDSTFEKSYVRFAHDWVELQKAAKPDILIDVKPITLLTASGVRSPGQYVPPGTPTTPAIPRPQPVTLTVVRPVVIPGLSGGWGTQWTSPPKMSVTAQSITVKPPPLNQQTVSPGMAMAMSAAKKAIGESQAIIALGAMLTELGRYESARSRGYHGLINTLQPSNPRAFVKLPVKATAKPSGIVGHVLLAATIGLTEGDRKFMADALADAAKQIKPKVTAAALARGVFEGPEFADVLAGDALPDRDEFKDRFVAGLNNLVKTKYPAAKGFAPERKEYASGPKYDPLIAEEKEAAVVPTTACLRCHEVRPTGKGKVFDPIPALAFDPLDKQARAEWVRVAPKETKQRFLARLQERLFTDADMPPEDSPEREAFREKQAAAFDDLKQFLEDHVEKPEPKKKP